MSENANQERGDAMPDTLELRSFGRRRGRTLSPRQRALMDEVLPKLSIDLTAPAPDDLRSLFSAGTERVAIEIGFGGAEHLLWQAHNDPKTGFIGCEPFEDGVAKALIGMEEGGIENIRFHTDDARDVLRWLPARSVDDAYILFPDPWPKLRHRKRRLVNAPTLQLLATTMKPGGRLRVATDIADYARTMLLAFDETAKVFKWQATRPSDWRVRPADWPQTRYETKAKREGRQSYYLTFLRSA